MEKLTNEFGEPWAVTNPVNALISNNDGHLVACTWDGTDNPKTSRTKAVSIAHRVMLCVNKCAGIKNNILEVEGYYIKEELESLDKIIELRAQAETEKYNLLNDLKKLKASLEITSIYDKKTNTSTPAVSFSFYSDLVKIIKDHDK